MISTEYVLSEQPFIVRRRVKWGECDPAGVVYTATFSDYVISIAELFYGSLFGGTPQAVKQQHGFGTPTRALDFDFRRSLWPDDVFDVRVDVTEIRTRTFTLTMTARKANGADGDIAFLSRLTPICIQRGVRESIEMPPVLRAALEQYRARCENLAAPAFAGEPTP